jgi:citrate synthase
LGEAVAHAGAEVLGKAPNLDLGLAVIARALGLPAGAALTIFAMGRAIGWIAHALEQ